MADQLGAGLTAGAEAAKVWHRVNRGDTRLGGVNAPARLRETKPEMRAVDQQGARVLVPGCLP